MGRCETEYVIEITPDSLRKMLENAFSMGGCSTNNQDGWMVNQDTFRERRDIYVGAIMTIMDEAERQ